MAFVDARPRPAARQDLEGVRRHRGADCSTMTRCAGCATRPALRIDAKAWTMLYMYRATGQTRVKEAAMSAQRKRPARPVALRRPDLRQPHHRHGPQSRPGSAAGPSGRPARRTGRSRRRDALRDRGPGLSRTGPAGLMRRLGEACDAAAGGGLWLARGRRIAAGRAGGGLPTVLPRSKFVEELPRQLADVAGGVGGVVIKSHAIARASPPSHSGAP